MSRVLAYRLFLGLIALLAFFALWSLAYELVATWRWSPALPSEGASRWGLLKYQNAQRSLS
ncbi:MAG: hypothetical protein E5W59_29600, partial [Mesorhizobium sp.]